jgi:beta-fructofuranosidase
VPLVLHDRWIWDFWLVEADGVLHAFYLQAPHSLRDPELRHWNCSIGHATSTDLVHWDLLPDALTPAPVPAWDDYTTWTGSVTAHDGVWHLLYTGSCRGDDGLVQRIGLATSTDLVHWDRHKGPVLEAADRWYAKLDPAAWPDEAWRDPWVVRDPAGGHYHLYATARSNTDGDPLGRGVVAHAVSTDLVHWDVLPPVTAPMGFGQLEVPQVVPIGGRWYLLFSTDTGTQSEMRRADQTGTGTYYLVGDSLDGPFEAHTLTRLEADLSGTTYAGKLYEWRGELLFFAWHGADGDGHFVGNVGDGRPVTVGHDGSLSLDPRPAAERLAR